MSTEVTLSSYRSTDGKRLVNITKNEGTTFVYFYENSELVNKIRNTKDILHAEELAEEFTMGFLNPKLLLG